MVIDLHVHTKPLSPDSDIEPEEAIQEAKRIGLGGICFTEHNKVWQARDLEELRQKWNFLVLCGVEVETSQGHILVFGLHKDFEGVIPIDEIKGLVDEAGGVMILAHPFQTFVVFGPSQIGLTPEQASKREIFHWVDLIEGFNGKVAPADNNLAQEVSKILGIMITGGSDAHSIKRLGRCVTIFEKNITNESQLISELKAGRFKGDYFRKGGI
jgi:hypothetical protein